MRLPYEMQCPSSQVSGSSRAERRNSSRSRDFAEAGFAGDEHHLTAAALRLIEVALQHAQLLRTADKWRQSAFRLRLKPCPDGRLLADGPIRDDRRRLALHHERAEWFAFEVIAGLTVRVFGEVHTVPGSAASSMREARFTVSPSAV